MNGKENELNEEELKKRIKVLKNALKHLYEGADLKGVKEEIKEVLKGLKPGRYPWLSRDWLRRA